MRGKQKSKLILPYIEGSPTRRLNEDGTWRRAARSQRVDGRWRRPFELVKWYCWILYRRPR
jgi:hypothetical protein